MGKKKGKQQSEQSQGNPGSSASQQTQRVQQQNQSDQTTQGGGQQHGQTGQQQARDQGQQQQRGPQQPKGSGQAHQQGPVGRGQPFQRAPEHQQGPGGRGQPPQQGQAHQRGPHQGQPPQQGQPSQRGGRGQPFQRASERQQGPLGGGQPPQQAQTSQSLHQHGQPPKSEEPRTVSQQSQPVGEGKSQKPSSKPGEPQAKKETAKSQAGKENQPPKKAAAGQPPSSKKSQTHQGTAYAIPPRQGTGFSGDQTVVEVNQLPLNLTRLTPEIYHYDVAIDPDKPKRFLRGIVAKFVERHCPRSNPAFDGKKNLYTAKPLPFGNSKEDKITMMNEERVSNNELEFQITVKLAQRIPTSSIRAFIDSRTTGHRLDVPQSAIQAIDVVLRAAPLISGPVPVGRSFFIPPSGRESTVKLGGGLELWYGFYQSAILNWKPYLNVDVAHKGFPCPTNLVDIFCQVCKLQHPEDRFSASDIFKFRGFVTTLKCDYEIPNSLNSRRTYRINNIGKSAEELRFRPDNGPEVSVVDYFLKMKNYRIRFPKLPTVQVDPPAKNIYLPLELCTLKAGQALNRKLDEGQTALMVRAAAQPPNVRKQRILDAIRTARYNRSPVVNQFGIEVNENLDRVNARILHAPGVQYKNQPNPQPQPGSWRAGQFMVSKELSKWFILNLDNRTRRDKINDFSSMLISQGRQLGMTIQNFTAARDLDTRRQQIKSDILTVLRNWKEQGAELVVVIIPGSGDFYSMVKRCAEIDVGVLTQCIKSLTMNKMNAATCGNILLKVNSKTNGKNHQLGDRFKPPVLKSPVMLVGIDVTHPSPDQTSIPSVAAVAASHDATAFQYNMIWRLQNPRVEIVEDLKNIIIEQLKYFHSRTKYKPEKIIVYRDGVSEGQFQQVLAAELNAIRQACVEIQPAGRKEDYKPGITFLVVQKRHHVRFFPTRREDEDGRNRNVPPGTIVDTQITHPRELDFYLVSHSSLQGTSRPTKYHRLWDDNNISEDDLEILTYYLCYMFSRCTRSVSYPAPTYYAHLAAFRARTYLENNPAPLDDLNGYANLNKIKDTFLKNSPMFFV